MKFTSTRKGLVATAPETVFQGLAPDGGLYLPLLPADQSLSLSPSQLLNLSTLGEAEAFVCEKLFGDFPEEVRKEAVARLLSRFPAEEPVPLGGKDGLHFLELFHGKTGAFKDVALSMLPVFMRHAAGGKRVLILTATSGDTGSAAMQGFAGVEGTEIIVFYPATGTSRIQRLQMTTPSEANVHAVGIRGNFDDAQAAVKRIFASPEINAAAAKAGITLSSANSINTGRLIPQIAYYILAAAKLARTDGGNPPNPLMDGSGAPIEFDVVVPSGNFGNILAAFYAKKLGAPIGKLIVASNVNDVLARFVKTGVYEPGEKFTVTNSPSMDIRISSNVERLLWMLNFEAAARGEAQNGDVSQKAVEYACAEVSRMMADLKAKGRYELNDAAKAILFAEFDGGVATPEETEAEMRRMREAAGYLIDPHTAVASFVAKRFQYAAEGAKPIVVAATATPYKFPETCRRAFGAEILDDPPPSCRDLEKLPVAQTRICDVDKIDEEVVRLF